MKTKIMVKALCLHSRLESLAHKKTASKCLGLLLVALAVGMLMSPEAFAVKEGEMKVGVKYLTDLLDNNIIPLVLLAGTGTGAAVSYMKSSFTPLVISLCTAGGYGFAHKWISAVYTACI
jgi:hypothetical protein